MLPAILCAILFLAAGTALRILFKPLQWIFIPASIVGGLLGLAFFQTLGSSWTNVTAELKSWPGLLIAVVFACMFLDRQSKSLQASLRLAGREGIVVWIIVLGQTAVGLLCTWLIIQPLFDVPNSFGMLIETGFAGGHGTAAAMGTVFQSESIGLQDGLDLGLFMATVGLVMSVVTGVVYVNLAIRLGWIGRTDRVSVIQGLEQRAEPEVVAKGTVRSEVIDPLVFQILIVGTAFGLGWMLKEGVGYGIRQATELSNSTQQVTEDATPADSEANASAPAETIAGNSSGQTDGSSVTEKEVEEVLKSRTSLAGTLGDFPLFIYTLFGGMIVRQVMQVLGIGDLIDSLSIQRISGVAMEFLIVAAIATLRIEAVAGLAAPLAILVGAAFLWTGFCLLFIGRRLLPEKYWFELGILNYGMSTGTTATGFTLLKIVDKDLDSGAAEDYALAAPLSAPFVGGGMLTIGLPLLLLERVPIAVSALSITAVVIALFFLGLRLRQTTATD